MIEISLYNSVTDIQSNKLISLKEVIESIKMPTFKTITEELRRTIDEKAKAQYKLSNFKGVAMSGIFSERSDDHLVKHSSLVCVDVDKMCHKQMEKVKALLNIIQKDIVAYFISPSGNGYKVVVHIDPYQFSQKDNYLAATNYLQSVLKVPLKHFDPSCSNVSRLCFLPYDENAYLNETVELTDSLSGVQVLDTRMWIKTDLQIEEQKKENYLELYENVFQSGARLDFAHKSDKINFHILMNYATRKGWRYEKGSRHNYIHRLASMANQFGMPKHDFIAHCKEVYARHPQTIIKNDKFDIDRELLPLIEDTYKRYEGQHSIWVETEINEEMETPCFPYELYENLPSLIKKPTSLFKSQREKDVFLLGVLTVLSNWMPKVYGKYSEMSLGANLFVVISAPAAAGKGTLLWARKLAKRVANELKSTYETNLAAYEKEMAELEEGCPKPQKPAKQKFIIPGNISSSAIIACIQANGDFGLIFETEADTLITVLNNDWGNWTDLLRRCFQHEPVSLMRKKDNEDIEIEKPHLSMVLSGTPSQVTKLVSSIENGFFSRILFYDFPSTNEWKNVFEKKHEDLEKYFEGYAIKLDQLLAPYFYDESNHADDLIEFKFTASQKSIFNDWFEVKQQQLSTIYGDDIIASVRRLAICFFRIAMILSVMRYIENSDKKVNHYNSGKKIVCSDEDYKNAEQIIGTLLYHTIKIFTEIKSGKRNRFFKAKKELFIETLPSDFTRAIAMEIASFIGIKEKTAEHYLGQFISQSKLQRVEHNKYKKNA